MIKTIEEAHAYLKVHGKDIGRRADAGNESCQKIIRMYQMHYKCPGDPGAQAFLIEYLNEFEKYRGKTEYTAVS